MSDNENEWKIEKFSGTVKIDECPGLGDFLKAALKAAREDKTLHPKVCPFKEMIGCKEGRVCKLTPNDDGISVAWLPLYCAAWCEEDGGYCQRIYPYGKPREMLADGIRKVDHLDNLEK